MDSAGSNYSNKVDLWSLGISCIEMAEKKPPLYELHSVRIFFTIPNVPPPTLSSPSSWSPEFNDFISKCLQKDPISRFSAAQLLEVIIFYLFIY